MKRFILTALVFSLCAGSISSYVKESDDYNTGTSLYLNLGLGRSTFTGDDYPDSEKQGTGGRNYGITFSFPLNRKSARFELGFLYQRTGTALKNSTGIINPRIELEYLTTMFNLGFESAHGLQFSIGLYFAYRLSAWERGDNVADRDLEDVVEPGDIGLNLKLAQRIHLSRKYFLAPYVKAEIGFINIYYSDFAQRNIMVSAGMEMGFRL